MIITICFTYFRSLTLANLHAALYSVLRQDFSRVREVIVVDNNTEDFVEDIQSVIDSLRFPIPIRLLSYKHDDPTRAHSWSTNVAVRASQTPWVFFSRADYVLDFGIVAKFLEVVDGKPSDWNGFVTGNVYHLHVTVDECEPTEWRRDGAGALRSLPGVEENYMDIDAGVWALRRDAFDRVGGLDEGLSAWGHSQTHFQHKLFLAGTEFVRIRKPLFFHPFHSAHRDIELAHRQLRERGVDVKEMWRRYEGVSPY